MIFKIFNNFITIFLIVFSLLSSLHLTNSENCSIPIVDSKRVEVLCYNSKTFISPTKYLEGGAQISSISFGYEEDQCLNGAEGILVRCRIGHRNKKSNGDPYLNICKNGEWENETQDSDDCELICGKFTTNEKPTPKPLLYKAEKADITSAPFHVGIYSNMTSSKFQQICGGSIIHTNIVVSAGHCFYNAANGEIHDSSYYLIGAGKHFRNYDANEQYKQFARVKEIHFPPTFQSEPLRNDIAVLVLDRHLQYTPYVEPVCINREKDKLASLYNSAFGHLYGWGATSHNTASSEELLTIKLATLSNTECKKRVDPNYRSDITGDRFCAINTDNSSACSGDSGGGLVIMQNRFYLAGIVSVGLNVDNYCSDGFVTLFTNVQVFIDFISKVVSESRNSEQNPYSAFQFKKSTK